ncbi:hypothetical protein GCM10020000_77870 [Streptomyces olivoverticillatus]
MGTPIMDAIFERGVFSQSVQEAPGPDEWMRRLGTLPLMHQPGERWQYQISNDVLGVLVARVTGQSFEAFLRERVLDPLGMKDTGFHVPAEKIDRLPTSYVPDPRTGEFTVWDEAVSGQYSLPPVFQSGGGGLVSTVDDCHAYFRMLLNGGMHGSERILSRPAVELMTTNCLTPEQNAARNAMARDNVHISFGQGQHGGWGLGMAVRTYRGDYAPIGQFGWDGGTGTSTYADPPQPAHRNPAHPGRDVHPGFGAAHPRLLDHALPGNRRLTPSPRPGRRPLTTTPDGQAPDAEPSTCPQGSAEST